MKRFIMPEDMPYTLADMAFELLTVAMGVGGLVWGILLSRTMNGPIPVHFNMSFDPDAWGTADAVIILLVLGLVIPVSLLLSLRFPNMSKVNLPRVRNTLQIRKLSGRYVRCVAFLVTCLLQSGFLMSVYWQSTVWRVVFSLILSIICILGLVMVIHLWMVGR